eukprot:CAMPEP_0184696036 /NCGR_PEP_ID=MMETSP0313-20130426/3466_1 /TAXON_ID=2792 /ORGANISM="Porphyridium aerugineum, Strain SAG 1380-2" /LENGTH=544 /DNA_ID=CAMNT_0027154591 /DNA_START=99 /DNA_END=1733 /DNA_ORIENTATION=+
MAHNPEDNDPLWNVDSILRHISSDAQLASWLLARQSVPPTAITPDMMKYSFTAKRYAVEEQVQPVKLFKKNERDSASQSRTNSSSNPDTKPKSSTEEEGARPNNDTSELRNLVFSEPETTVTVLHGTGWHRSFATIVDSRSPFSFLEPPSDAAAGVHRVVIERAENHLFFFVNYFLVNGNSCLLILRFPYDPSFPGKKCFLVLRPYPANRYPGTADVIESAFITALPTCQYCIFRGSATCECSILAWKRSKPQIPSDQRDPWSLFNRFMLLFESNLQSHRVVLTNYVKNIIVTTKVMTQVVPTIGHSLQEEHASSYQHYLDSVLPAFNDKMISWAMPVSDPSPQPGMLLEAPQPLQQLERARIDEMPDNSVEIDMYGTEQGVGQDARRGASSSHRDASQKSSMDHPNVLAKPGSQDDMDDGRKKILSYLDEVSKQEFSAADAGVCKLCSVQFRRKFDLKRHIKTKHLPEERQYTCHICDFSFKRQEHLVSHTRQVHNKSNQVACMYCSVVVSSESNRRRHIRLVHPEHVASSSRPHKPDKQSLG